MLDRILIGSSAEPTDPNFENVTLLLHGDGSNGAQNNTFIDSSTNNFTITRNGNTTQGSFSPYGSNWSNYLDGNGDYLDLADSTAFQFGSGDYTYECWVFPTKSYSTSGLIEQGVISYGAPGTFNNTNILNFGIEATTGYLTANLGYTVTLVGTSQIPLNTWTHIVLCRTSGRTSIYVNGVREATTTTSITFTTNSSSILRIGGQWFAVDTARQFGGYISNVRVVKGSGPYDAANTTIPVPTAPLTAITNTSLLTCAYNRFRDGSTNNFTITRNGDVKVTNFAPFAPSSAYSTSTNGGSAYFDGTGDYLTTSYTTANFDWFTSGVDYTIEYWFYANSLTGISYSDAGVNHSTVIGNRDAASTTDYWSFGPTSAGTVTFYYFASGAQSVTTTASFVVNSWNHVAMTKTSSGITLFVNGVAGTTTAIVNSPTSSTGTPLTIGQGNNSAFNGYVSNLRIVRGTAIYSGNFTPPSSPVTAVTNTKYLLNATNAAIFDNSMKNDLETVGNAQISTSVKKFGTGSMYFDGSGDVLQIPYSVVNSLGSDSAWTVELWFYSTTSTGANRTLFRTQDGGFAGVAIVQNGTNLYVDLSTSGSAWNWSTGAKSFSLNTWNHLAVVRNGSTTTAYLNGTSYYSASSVSIWDSGSPIYIGGRGISADYFEGYIDDLRITKGVARYTANFTPPTAAFPNK